VSYSGVTLASGQTLDTVRLNATHLEGSRNGQTYRGNDFLMAEFLGNLADGSQVRLRIDGISPAPAPNADLNTYYVTYLGEDGVRYPACVDNAGVGTTAIPVSGRWNYQSGVPGGGSKIEDPSSFTFGCMGAAIAKCVVWGYRPWATRNGVSLAQHHQACTRMTRADFCGDGSSYTQNGKRIALYDSFGIQQDTDAWQLESVWGPNGAQCFRQYNRYGAGISCYQPSFETSCNPSSPFSNGGLLAVEIP